MSPWVYNASKTGCTLSTEIDLKPIPRIPSNLAAIKETPLIEVTSPNVIFGPTKSPNPTLSDDRYPLTAPLPYLIARVVPFFE